MIKAIEQPSADLQLAIEQVGVAGAILEHDFQLPLEDLPFDEKDDRIRSLVGKTDVSASNVVVENIGLATGEKTITEEYARALPHLLRFIASYDDDDVWCLDPLDGTKDFRDALLANPTNDPAEGLRVSLAMVSLAKIMGGQTRLGALLAPLLAGPSRLYAAEEGKGAFVEVAGARSPLQANKDQNEGIILVSENEHAHIDRIAQVSGLTVVRLGGLAFKMLCVVDPELIHGYAPRLGPHVRRLFERLPILGLVSPSAGLHDY
ncbi:MAG TPA: inositol monophosphatase family protein, partial [Candidatus Saccharimonadales bacterium]|nr:inositol monophosphatase family protein [Candidatus Saccharimonadales bacterium]